MNDDLPYYKHWKDVPAGLHTKNQLATMEPARKLFRGAKPVARVRYMGNKVTVLYRLADSIEKPSATEGQLRAVAAATAAQWVCKRCGYQADPNGRNLGRGRLCGRCRLANSHYEEHLAAQTRASAWLIETRRVLVHASVTSDGLPNRIVAIRVGSEDVLGDWPADPAAEDGATSYRSVIADMHEVLTGAGVWHPASPPYVGMAQHLVGWNQDTSARACDRLLSPTGFDPQQWQDAQKVYPWLGWWPDIESTWAGWYQETAEDDRTWRFREYNYRPALPGATGDVMNDALLMVGLLKAIATGDAPTSPSARFRHPTHGPEITTSA